MVVLGMERGHSLSCPCRGKIALRRKEMKAAVRLRAVASGSSLALLLGGALGGCLARSETGSSGPRPRLAAAEALIDAFYSFDPSRLRRAMSRAPGSVPAILYYQGWAQGGNYVVLERKPCRLDGTAGIRCDITVRDDLIAALGTGYHVTDTFHISFKDGDIATVRTSSNDPPQFDQALSWLRREKPEVFTGPCRGFFAAGPTPQDCVRAVVRGFTEFKAGQP
jgi:hypothetical protein